jgi:hypothetical protein
VCVLCSNIRANIIRKNVPNFPLRCTEIPLLLWIIPTESKGEFSEAPWMVKFTHYAVASTSCHMHTVLLYFLLPPPHRALPVDHSVTLQAAPSCMPSHCLLCWKSIMIVIPSDYTHAMLRYQPESVVQVTATVSGGSENVALFCCWHTGLIF